MKSEHFVIGFLSFAVGLLIGIVTTHSYSDCIKDIRSYGAEAVLKRYLDEEIR